MMKKLCALAPCWVFACAAPALARDVPVDSAAALKAAITAAQPGDVIILAPGTYRTTGESCSADGTADRPIVVKSAAPLAAKLQLDSLEGFRVTGAHWHFEGLDVSGVCQRDVDCEHAFHVMGGAVGFVLRDSRVFDFNAQLKVNAAQVGGTWRIPHAGLVERNEIADAHPRATSSPVTKLNIDTGDNWVVRANYIHDGHKAGGDNISYAAFMKSGGRNGTFERNLVICSRSDTTGGVRIGLSFGGGGTGAQFCAPAFSAMTPCDPEHSDGTMKNNIIVNCSDVGIYLNKARQTKLLFNTLIATSGIDFRFASSTGEADGNVLAGKIRARDGATFVNKQNLTEVTAFEAWYVSPSTGDLRTKGELSALLQKVEPRAEVTDDYCARSRTGARHTLGALEHSLGDCETTRPPAAGMQTEDAGATTMRADAGRTPTSDAGVGPSPADAGSGVVPPIDAAMGDSVDAAAGGAVDSAAGAGDATVTPARREESGCSASGRSTWSAWILALALGLRRRRAKRLVTAAKRRRT